MAKCRGLGNPSTAEAEDVQPGQDEVVGLKQDPRSSFGRSAAGERGEMDGMVQLPCVVDIRCGCGCGCGCGRASGEVNFCSFSAMRGGIEIDKCVGFSVALTYTMLYVWVQRLPSYEKRVVISINQLMKHSICHGSKFAEGVLKEEIMKLLDGRKNQPKCSLTGLAIQGNEPQRNPCFQRPL
jgi:hypothetical protein